MAMSFWNWPRPWTLAVAERVSSVPKRCNPKKLFHLLFRRPCPALPNLVSAALLLFPPGFVAWNPAAKWSSLPSSSLSLSTKSVGCANRCTPEDPAEEIVFLSCKIQRPRPVGSEFPPAPTCRLPPYFLRDALPSPLTNLLSLGPAVAKLRSSPHGVSP